MNNERRGRLRNCRQTLNKIKDELTDIRDEIESVRDDEDDARDNMPENLCESERYLRSEECSDAMDSAISSIEEAIDFVTEAI